MISSIDRKYLALVVSAAAVFSLRFLRVFDLEEVAKQLALHRASGGPTSPVDDFVYLFLDRLSFIVQRDWSRFGATTIVAFAILTVVLLATYFALRRRYSPEAAAATALVILIVLPILTTALLSLWILLGARGL